MTMTDTARSDSFAALPDSALVRPLQWVGGPGVGGLDGFISMIDQTKLPTALEYIECRDPETVFAAIRRLSVRGAPAIGIAAAMGLVLGIRDFGVRPGVGDEGGGGHEGFVKVVNRVSDYLASSRPTAVNLFWALERMKRCALKHMAQSIDKIKQAMLDEALAIRDEDARMCHAIGRHGAALIPEGGSVITHCNAGSLATAEYGTALAPMYASHAEGKSFTVYVDETRPLLQGARLTAWELIRAGIQIALICDNAAAHVMKRKGVDVVITGADRIAANGDAANKIGTYGLAVLAQAHGVPFYIAAPSSTFDLDACDGDSIPIEERDPDEIRRGFGVLTAPVDAPCYCPAFDVTPASLIAGIITEKGLISPVTGDSICETLGS